MIETYVPQYRRIEIALRERIATLQPGDELPSDADLCAEFLVSRMTARNAMQHLAEEGLVVRRPGRGSFVARPFAHRRAHRLMTFTHEMRRRGLTPTSRVLTREVRPSTPDEAASLGLPPGAPVVHLHRLRCADDRPIALESTVLIEACGAAVMGADLERGSLHEALAATGHRLRHGNGTITADAATADDARWLGIKRGDPLLVERRVITDQAGRRFEATESRYAAGRYAIDVDFEVDASEPGRDGG